MSKHETKDVELVDFERDWCSSSVNNYSCVKLPQGTVFFRADASDLANDALSSRTTDDYSFWSDLSGAYRYLQNTAPGQTKQIIAGCVYEKPLCLLDMTVDKNYTLLEEVDKTNPKYTLFWKKMLYAFGHGKVRRSHKELDYQLLACLGNILQKLCDGIVVRKMSNSQGLPWHNEIALFNTSKCLGRVCDFGVRLLDNAEFKVNGEGWNVEQALHSAAQDFKVMKSRLEGCNECGDNQNVLEDCSGCKIAKYCSKSCQKRHWKQHHKLLCKSLKTSTSPLK